jgi:N-formylglutamate deformylase
MNSVGGAMSSDAGRPRADIVLGDRDGTTCDPALTDWVRERFAALGYDVRVNDPFKGVELVRAYSAPGAGRHSLQVEINKRVYMDELRREVLPHFAVLQSQITDMLRDLVDALGHGPGPLRLGDGRLPFTTPSPSAVPPGVPDAR